MITFKNPLDFRNQVFCLWFIKTALFVVENFKHKKVWRKIY